MLAFPLCFVLLFLSSSTLPSTSLAATGKFPAPCNKNEASALLDIKRSFGSSMSFAAWVPSVDCCYWTGVWCDRDTGRVVDLALATSNTTGPISPSIGRLSSLRTLFISAAVTGTLPPSIGHLANLTVIRIRSPQASHLSGTIPDSFCNLSKLTQLDLTGNKISGSIPRCVGRSLETIQLGQNQLEFDMTSMRFPPRLKVLDLSQNKIYGSIPRQILQLRRLTSFNVSYNNLCGPVPAAKGFDASSYEHNRCLCGGPLKPCPAPAVAGRT